MGKKDLTFPALNGSSHSLALEGDLRWAAGLISEQYDYLEGSEVFHSTTPAVSFLLEMAPPAIEHHCPYSQLVRRLQADHNADSKPVWYHAAERLVLAMGLMPHLYPYGLTPLIALDKAAPWENLICPAYSMRTKLFIPTIESALFLIAGVDITTRKEALKIFSPTHVFSQLGVFYYPKPPSPDPKSAAPIHLGEEYYSLLVEGEPFRPGFSHTFAAQLLEVREDWEDFIAHEDTMAALEDINLWLQQREAMDNDVEISKRSKKGYRALFYGPSGTGKTMSAGLVGKKAGLPVYRVDLSAVVSKYIGETEKNLEAIFQKAEHKDWILFFDEADALFGKRSQTNTANDRYANQEVSYLLQRIEDFNGLVILSSNLKSNMDSAFTRRFQNIVKYNMPTEGMRRQLFLSAFKDKYRLQDDAGLEEACSKKYALTGAEINNIFRYCAMRVLKNNDGKGVPPEVFNNAMVTELKKKGKLQ